MSIEDVTKNSYSGVNLLSQNNNNHLVNNGGVAGGITSNPLSVRSVRQAEFTKYQEVTTLSSNRSSERPQPLVNALNQPQPCLQAVLSSTEIQKIAPQTEVQEQVTELYKFINLEKAIKQTFNQHNQAIINSASNRFVGDKSVGAAGKEQQQPSWLQSSSSPMPPIELLS